MGDKLERFEAWIHKTDREYLSRVKRSRGLTSNAAALREVLKEHRKTSVTLTEEPCVTDSVQ